MSKKKDKMKQEAFERFDFLLKEDDGEYTEKLEFGQNYVVFSDFHIGDGSKADNFRKNNDAMIKALKYYRNHENKYSIILLGDIEEFHQFALDDIKEEYKGIYNELNKFPKNRIHRVYGNHDIEWGLTDPLFKKQSKTAKEAIKIGDKIMLTHGHQAEESYEKDIHVVRTGTTIFRFIENLLNWGSSPILSESPSFKDYIYSEWAQKEKINFICGHTHCPILRKQFIDLKWAEKKYKELEEEFEALKNSGDKKRRRMIQKWKVYLHSKIIFYKEKDKKIKHPKSPDKELSNYYYNTGACLFSEGFTNIEINGDLIQLFYWNNFTDEGELLWETKIS